MSNVWILQGIKCVHHGNTEFVGGSSTPKHVCARPLADDMRGIWHINP